MARLRKERLLEDIGAFLDVFPRLAPRRRADRQTLLNKSAGELLAWSALIAERGPDRLPERLFAASCALLSPCDPWWAGLLVSGLQEEVTAHVAGNARRARDADATNAEVDRLAPAEARAIPELRLLADRIEAGEARATEVEAVATELLMGAIAETPEALDESAAVLESSLALTLLEVPLPIPAEDLADTIDTFAADFPAMLDHAQSHADDPDFDSQAEGDDEDLDDEPDATLALAKGLDMLDKRLAMTDDGDEGAALAQTAATLLLLSCSQFLAGHELKLGLESRLQASLLALNSEDDGLPVRDLPETGLELVVQDLRRAAGFLARDDSTVKPAAATTTESLTRLDTLISAVNDVAEFEDVEDSLAGSLGLAGAAVEVIQAGIGLSGTSKTRGGLVRAMAVLDPAALCVDRQVRLQAAGELEELARAVAGG